MSIVPQIKLVKNKNKQIKGPGQIIKKSPKKCCVCGNVSPYCLVADLPAITQMKSCIRKMLDGYYYDYYNDD